MKPVVERWANRARIVFVLFAVAYFAAHVALALARHPLA